MGDEILEEFRIERGLTRVAEGNVIAIGGSTGEKPTADNVKYKEEINGVIRTGTADRDAKMRMNHEQGTNY
jgi:hypothetical protein